MDINYLKTKIEDKLNQLNHSYIKKLVGNPNVDEDKLIFIASLIDSRSSLSTNEKERFIITSMLIQIALDTHELVPIDFDDEMSKDIKTQNQLRVLAGDYYSGHYYLLLAEMNEIELIQVFASAIKEINENKMKLYYLENATLEESIAIINRIDVLLFLAVSEYLQDETLNELVSEWLLINRLIQERNNILNDVETIFLSKLPKDNLINELELFIQKRIPSVELLLGRLPNDYLELKSFLTKKLTCFTKSK